jgi:Uncharacterised nucleotidyltransferase
MAVKPTDPATRGESVARVLAGAWRSEPLPVDLEPSELEAITPLLVRSGSGALAWWRLRNSAHQDTPAERSLRQAYRRHAIDAEIHRRRAAELLTRLSAAGVEPLLVKGPAIAQLYPEAALRPYADLDLIIRHDQISAAASCLAASPIPRHAVDLHDGPASLDTLDFDELDSRAVSVTVGELTVRVPAPEDHLRILAVHALRHGMVRPLWLCDLAVAVESRPADFAWRRCLGPDRRRAEWVVTAIALAHQLLGADLTGTPIAAGTRVVPEWLSRAVLRAWGRATGDLSERPPAFRALIGSLGDRRRFCEEWVLRWDKPIQATIELAGPLNGMPRFPFQLAIAVRRLPKLIRTVRTMTCERWQRRARARFSRARDSA